MTATVGPPETSPTTTPPAAPSWAGPPPPASPAGTAPIRPPSRGPLLAVVAVVVVVVVVVLALLLTGVIPGLSHSGPSSSGNPSAETFSQSEAAANGAASGYHGGGYSPVYAVGFSSTIAVPIPVGELSSSLTGGACAFTAISSTSSVTVPASGNLSQGTAADWLFLMHNTSGILVVIVVGGSASLLGTLGGSSTCTSAFGEIGAIPSTMVDSSTASLALDTRGGYAFLHAHSTAIASEIAIGPIGGLVAAEWTIEYAACDPTSATTTTGLSIEATIGATGAVQTVANATSSCGFSTGSTGPGSTGSGGALASDLALATPREASVGANYWYNFSVQSAAGGLTWGDLILVVETASGGYVAITGAPGGLVSVDGLSGTAVATYSVNQTSWASGGSTAVSNTQLIVLQCTNDLEAQGDTFVAVGTGAISGLVSVGIP